MTQFSKKYIRNRKYLRTTLWILVLILIFLVFGLVIMWALNPRSADQIRQFLGIEATPTPTPSPTPTPPATPTPSPTPTPTPAPGYIMIDPGRGGPEKDPHKSPDGTVYEKDLNLEIAKLLKERLELRGYVVEMTRTEDVEVSQAQRAKMANESGADLFISIRMNSLTSDETVNGLEILYGSDHADSMVLASTLIRPIIDSCGAKNRGIKSSKNYTVLNDTLIPSVVIDIGFISCQEEVDKLMKFTYRDTLVTGICNGIDSYFTGK